MTKTDDWKHTMLVQSVFSIWSPQHRSIVEENWQTEQHGPCDVRWGRPELVNPHVHHVGLHLQKKLLVNFSLRQPAQRKKALGARGCEGNVLKESSTLFNRSAKISWEANLQWCKLDRVQSTVIWYELNLSNQDDMDSYGMSVGETLLLWLQPVSLGKPTMSSRYVGLSIENSLSTNKKATLPPEGLFPDLAKPSFGSQHFAVGGSLQ